MSGWGCRYQYDEQCLRLRKECRPGMPGCVLYGKVTFARDLESKPGSTKGQAMRAGRRPGRARAASR